MNNLSDPAHSAHRFAVIVPAELVDRLAPDIAAIVPGARTIGINASVAPSSTRRR
jgi:hypothetical protein